MAAEPKEIAQIDNTFTSKPDPTGGTPGTRLEAGLYYSTNANPRTYGDTTASLSGTNNTATNIYTHTINIYDLVPNSKYYTQGYVANATGIYSGSITPVQLTTLETVQINSQIWTLRNCNVTRYSDGTPIPYEPDATKWTAAVSGAWCYYNNNSGNDATYGKLYNWYAVAGIHDVASATNTALRKSLAPKGYHIPTDAEWDTLTDYLGGTSIAGGKMKATGTSLWNTPNAEATNTSGFGGLPGGYRNDLGTFNNIGGNGLWWSSSETDYTPYAWNRNLNYNNGNANRNNNNKKNGFSVRFISDAITPIGQQLWTTKNLDVATYSDGTVIPQVTDPTEWANLTTGAWCYYSDLYGNDKIYGKLYNWYAVNDLRGLAPTGYYIPSDDEYIRLADYLGTLNTIGNSLKANSSLWTNNTGTNTTGFSGIPGGVRYGGTSPATFSSINSMANFWTSTQNPSNTLESYHYYLTGGHNSLVKSIDSKKSGFSIRVLSETSNQTAATITGTGYSQAWSDKNLDVIRYRDGTPIPRHIGSDTQWAALTTGAWCYYNNDSATGTTYGKLYNWYAVKGIHTAESATPTAAQIAARKVLAPIGWRVPSGDDWTALTSAIGGASNTIREVGTAHWNPNVGATNSTGLTILPGGYRGNGGIFDKLGLEARFWSTTDNWADPYKRNMVFVTLTTAAGVATGYILHKYDGFSVRLVRDYA